MKQSKFHVKKINLGVLFSCLVLGMIFNWPNLSKMAYALSLYSVEDALEEIFPEAEDTKKEIKTLTKDQKKSIEKSARIKFDAEFDKEFIFYVLSAGGKTIGYAVEGEGRGKHAPIHYMVAFDTDKKIKQVMVLEYKEKRGKPVAYPDFLDQFMGKGVNDKIRLDRDIDGVSGATISSTAMTEGAKKMLHVFHVLYP